jgi:predicted RNA binding protein YcfA (HicA-like mRNA interferase family)
MLTARQVIRTLEKAGFQVQRQVGSHARLRHPDGRVVTVPIHAGQDIGRGVSSQYFGVKTCQVSSKTRFHGKFASKT